MSLGCFECMCVGGPFNTLIIFDADKKFDLNTPISHYNNFYTCCARFSDFQRPVKKSRFMVVEEPVSQVAWNTGSDGIPIKKAKYKYISEAELKKKLPKTFMSLSGETR